MNLFRSEEHARRWAQFDPASEDGVISLTDLLVLFGSESRRHLMDGNYVSRWLPKRGAERLQALESIGKSVPLWLGSP